MRRYALGLYEKATPAAISWEERLDVARGCGFDYLEISVDGTDDRLGRLEWPRERRERLRRAAFERELPIETMCLSGHRQYPLGSRDAAVRRRALEIMAEAVDLAACLGVRLIQLAGYDVYAEKGGPDTRRRFEEGLAACVELASRAGVLLGLETMENGFMDTVSKAMVYVSRARSPYLGLYPDIGNLQNACVLYGSDLLADLAVGQGHIFAVHLKETRPGVYRNMRFGEGHTPYEPCVSLLHGMGVRRFTAECWHQGETDYRAALRVASRFLRGKIEAGIALETAG